MRYVGQLTPEQLQALRTARPPPVPALPEEEPGILDILGRGLKRSAAVALPETAGQALQYLGLPDGGLTAAARARGELPEYQLFDDSALSSGAERVVPSVAPVMSAYGALSAVPGLRKAAPVLAPALGALFAGSAQGQSALEQGAELPDADNRMQALKQAGIEAGGEFGSELVLMRLLKGVAPYLPGSAKATVGALTGASVLAPFAKKFIENMFVQGATEAVQAAGQVKVAEDAGIKTGTTPLKAALDVQGPTAVLSTLLGIPAAGVAKVQASGRAKATNVLADGEADPTQRVAAARALTDYLKDSDPVAAKTFQANALRAITNSEPITFDETLFDQPLPEVLAAPAAPEPVGTPGPVGKPSQVGEMPAKKPIDFTDQAVPALLRRQAAEKQMADYIAAQQPAAAPVVEPVVEAPVAEAPVKPQLALAGPKPLVPPTDDAELASFQAITARTAMTEKAATARAARNEKAGEPLTQVVPHPTAIGKFTIANRPEAAVMAKLLAPTAAAPTPVPVPEVVPQLAPVPEPLVVQPPPAPAPIVPQPAPIPAPAVVQPAPVPEAPIEPTPQTIEQPAIKRVAKPKPAPVVEPTPEPIPLPVRTEPPNREDTGEMVAGKTVDERTQSGYNAAVMLNDYLEEEVKPLPLEQAKQLAVKNKAAKAADTEVVPHPKGKKGYALVSPQEAALLGKFNKLMAGEDVSFARPKTGRTFKGELETDDPAVKVWKLLTSGGKLNELPSVGGGRTVQKVAEQMFPPDSQVSVTLDKGGKGDIKFWSVKWTVNDLKNKRRPKVIEGFIMEGTPETDTAGQVWIDLDGRNPGENSSFLYQTALTYANNSGKEYVEDPAGVSAQATARRLGHLMSSAARHQRLTHFRVGDANLKPKEGSKTEPIKSWGLFDQTANLKELMRADTQTTDNLAPSTNQIVYNFKSRRYEDRANGNQPVSSEDFEAHAVRARRVAASAGTARVGNRSLRRAALQRSILEASSEGGGQGLLEKLRGLSREDLRDLQRSIDRVYYSRPAQEAGPRPAVGQAAPGDPAQQGLVDRLGRAVFAHAKLGAYAPGTYRPAKFKDAEQKLLDVLSKKLGLKIIGVQTDRSTFNGVKLPGLANTIFIDIQSTQPVLTVAMHELVHDLAQTKPNLYAALKTEVVNKMTAPMWQQFITETNRQDEMDQGWDKISEELMGDAMGWLSQRPEFWTAFDQAKVGQKKGLVQKLWQAIKNFMGKFIDPIRKQLTGQTENFPYFKNLLDLEQRFAELAAAPKETVEQDDGAVTSPAYQLGQRRRDEAGQTRSAAANPSATTQQVVQDVKSLGTDWLDQAKTIGLGALGRRQLTDIYADLIPGIRQYSDTMQRFAAAKNSVMSEADDITIKWGKLAKPEQTQLAGLMNEATLEQTDPAAQLVDQPWANKEKHPELVRKYQALSPAAKEVYTTARDAYKNHWEQVQQALQDRVQRAEIADNDRQRLLDQIRLNITDKLRGVYFPLARFGKFYVKATNEKGETIAREQRETLSAAQEVRRQLLAEYPGATISNVQRTQEFEARGENVPSAKFMAELVGLVDSQMTDETATGFKEALNQLYLVSLPETSWAKRLLRRKGVAGYSDEARRAFAYNMTKGASYLARINFTDQLTTQLNDLQKYVDGQVNNSSYDSAKAQAVINELRQRTTTSLRPANNPLSSMLTGAGFLWHMGLSPASAMINLSQTALVAFPVIGAKYGFTQTAKALGDAMVLAAKHKNKITNGLSGDEKAAMDQAVKDGVVELTQAYDLAGVADGTAEGPLGKAWEMSGKPVMRLASAMFHHAERFNRQTTFLAAYRLAKQAGESHEAAAQTASKLTYDSHFDYSFDNRARWLQGNVARVVLLFKQYAQNMIYTLVKSASQGQGGLAILNPNASKEEREAAKLFASMLAMHGMAAGFLGLPVVNSMLSIASSLGGSDDDPWDAKVALRNYLAEALGAKPAEMLMKGLPRGVPGLEGNFASRVGLDSLIFPDTQEAVDNKTWFRDQLLWAMGPVVGIGDSLARGADLVGQGDYLRGAELLLPKAVRDPIKAWRYHAEGVRDKTGIEVVKDTNIAEELWQGIGMSPRRVAEAYEGIRAIRGQDEKLKSFRQELIAKYAKAEMNDEPSDETLDQVIAWNDLHPERKITMQQLMQSINRRQQRIDSAERGLVLSDEDREEVDELDTFARPSFDTIEQDLEDLDAEDAALYFRGAGAPQTSSLFEELQ